MDFQKLIESITPEIYNNLKRAVELGKWPDGSSLTAEQKKNSLQVIIAYDARHKPEEDRIGYIPPKVSKEPCSSKNGSSQDGSNNMNDEQPIRWQD